jgi:hypothetical protein
MRFRAERHARKPIRERGFAQTLGAGEQPCMVHTPASQRVGQRLFFLSVTFKRECFARMRRIRLAIGLDVGFSPFTAAPR